MPCKSRIRRKKKKYKAYKKGGPSRSLRSTRVIIKTTKKYGKYLVKHLAKEHPKTKGKIKLK